MSDLKKIYLGTNTKMFKTAAQTKQYIAQLCQLTKDIDPKSRELFVLPSYTSIASAIDATDGTVTIGSQSIGWEEQGQFTGEISPLMLEEAGAKIVMVGHSERRHVMHETDEEEALRVQCASQHGFTTLLCVGETAEQKDCDIGKESIAVQLKKGLSLLSGDVAKTKLWIAYEPVWAIGVNGIPADPSYANAIHKVIKDVLCQLYGDDIGLSIPVLYGGSVNFSNAEALIDMAYIDGLFIGRMAWDAENFNALIRKVILIFNSKKTEI